MVRLLVTYMERMTTPDGLALPPPTETLAIAREQLSVEDYLRLYLAVGAPLQWDEHTRLPQEKLAAFLSSSSTAIHILRDTGKAVGLCAFAGIGERSVELKYFGLIPDAQGRGLGPYLLDWSLRSIWSHGTKRIWLHTDTNDHPKAKATYLRNGFEIYAENWEEFAD